MDWIRTSKKRKLAHKEGCCFWFDNVEVIFYIKEKLGLQRVDGNALDWHMAGYAGQGKKLWFFACFIHPTYKQNKQHMINEFDKIGIKKKQKKVENSNTIINEDEIRAIIDMIKVVTSKNPDRKIVELELDIKPARKLLSNIENKMKNILKKNKLKL